MSIKAAIFDVDGTLINSLIIWDVIWTKIGEKYLGNPDFRPNKEDDKAVRTMTLGLAMQYIQEKYHLADTIEELVEDTQRIVKEFYANDVEVKPGVMEFLKYCKAKKIKMCIASATEMELLQVAVERCGLKPYFDKIFSCGMIGKGKDKPDIFLLAKDYLNEENENICVFEDSLVAIETAIKVGMKTVAIYDDNNYGQEQMQAIADLYIYKEETLNKVIKSQFME